VIFSGQTPTIDVAGESLLEVRGTHLGKISQKLSTITTV
jgi:hypothetical protein